MSLRCFNEDLRVVMIKKALSAIWLPLASAPELMLGPGKAESPDKQGEDKSWVRLQRVLNHGCVVVTQEWVKKKKKCDSMPVHSPCLWVVITVMAETWYKAK